MSTSLAEQLQKLSVPQATIYYDAKQKDSLLFDPKEAATKDRDTFYEIGLSGLNELINLYEGFRIFEDTLFSVSSKNFERAVRSKQENEHLDRNIEKFLHHLSPYFLLQSSHKALEWLINRYHIQQYNQDAIMGLILPYYDTKIFVRFIQIMDIKGTSNRWNWLEPIKKNGIPLSKQVLYNHCSSNKATMKFIGQSTCKHVADFGDRASQLSTVFAFFCSSAIGAIEASKKIKESLIVALLPTINEGIISAADDFRAAVYMVVGYLMTKAHLSEKTVNHIVERILTSDYVLTYEMILLVNVVYSTQNVEKISDKVLNDLTAERMPMLCLHIGRLIQQNINVTPFCLRFLSTVLPFLMQSNNEEFRRSVHLAEILIEQVDFKKSSPQEIIKCFFECFQPSKSQTSNGYESDIEIVDEDDIEYNEVTVWYAKILKSLEHKYPAEFDKVLKEILDKEKGISEKRHSQLAKILTFKPSVSYRIGDNYLFENLNHVNPELRIQAVICIAKEFSKIKSEDIEFLKESIINRYRDENYQVVSTTLKIPIQYIHEVLTPNEITESFVAIISRRTKSKKWKAVVKEAIEVFCSLESLMVNQDTVLAIVPHLFPKSELAAETADCIIKSSWGRRFVVTKLMSEQMKTIANKEERQVAIRNAAFEVIFNQNLADSIELNYNDLDKSDTLKFAMYLILRSHSLANARIETSIEFVDSVIEFVKNRQINFTDEFRLSALDVLSFIKLCKDDIIEFKVLSHLLEKVIESTKVNNVTMPWYNVCNSPEAIFLRKVFEICMVGIMLPLYSRAYCSLLQNLLKGFCVNPRDKIEFMANFGCAHILYAEVPENVITPELQIRTLVMIKSLLGKIDNADWIFESNIPIMIVLNLNSPLGVTRNCTMDIVEKILERDPDSNHCMRFLLNELFTRRQELSMDHEQLPQILYALLSQEKSQKDRHPNAIQPKLKECLDKLISIITNPQTPTYISSELIEALNLLNTSNLYAKLVKATENIRKHVNTSKKKLHLDIYDSQLMRHIYNRLTVNTAKSLETPNVWEFLIWSLNECRAIVIGEDHKLVSPSILILKQIDGDVYKSLSDKKATQFVTAVCEASTSSDNAIISSEAYKVMKKIDLHIDHFRGILESMLAVKDPEVDKEKHKKRNVDGSMLSHQTSETKEWKVGVKLLEFIQSKKRLTVDDTFIPLMFKLLKKCLEFDEQSYVEYTKQLILSSIWFYSEKFVMETNPKKLKALKSAFDIEAVVQCIRGTQNPQTHHHALILLSHASHILPEDVLHHTMAIFTFIGSSVLRHDDDYSFQIIEKIIETIVPILVNLKKDVDVHSPKEMVALQKKVVPVLRVFADVVLDVPEHRRLPLYKKLLETLGAAHFLWVFLGLLLETYIRNYQENKGSTRDRKRSLVGQQMPLTRLDIAQSILLEFPPEIILGNFVKLMLFLKSLPINKDENQMDTDIDQSEIFSVNGHTAMQLRHYKYTVITFLNSCLSSPLFINHIKTNEIKELTEGHYKTLIVNILTFIQSVSKMKDEGETANKYWRVMLHYSYDLLDHVNNLLSAPMFLSVVRGLLHHTLHTVRRKSMEILNSKIQTTPEIFEDVDKDLICSLLPALLDIVKSIPNKDETISETLAQEIELNQQTALLSLKLLTRLLASGNPEPFKPILECITDLVSSDDISGNVMASVVLCLAELCSNLKAHALASLKKFMPALIKVLKKQRKVETPELILLSTITAVGKIVDSLPLFLSPYLQKLIYEYSILAAKWQNFDQDCSKVIAVVSKLNHIKVRMASSIAPRVLIPAVNKTYEMHLSKGNLEAIGPVMSVLAESFSNISKNDFTALRQELTAFSLSALQLRSNAVKENADMKVVDRAEGEIVNALVSLVLKLSESNFRPFYFKIYDWAVRTNVDGEKDRVITFYRLSSVIAERLKGLFVLFAGHFIKNAAELLDSCNVSKSEQLFFDDNEKCITLIEYIIKTLRIVFLYDSQNFINKERFETLMAPVVDQMENSVGGIERLKIRSRDMLVPCIGQFAVAIADDSLWKPLNYHVLLKTRHNDAEIRLIALECLVNMASQLGSSWLPLLAESVPFLAELLEDGDSSVETATKDAVRKLEGILGEPLQKYF